VPKTLAELRALTQSQPVQKLDDLRGYRSGKGWLSLDLGIRRGAEETVVRERVEVERRAFTVERFDPGQVFRRNGIALCALEGWPEARLPALAARSDVLVLRVERDSEAGKAGLRPLDLVTDVERFRLTGKAQVRKPGGAFKTVTVPRRAGRIDLWIPLLFSFESDGFRSHEGLGPLDVLSHSSSSTHYDAATDGYTTAERESRLTIFQRLSWAGQGGVSSFYQLNPFIDAARLRYLMDYEPLGETGEGREGDDPSLDWAKRSEVESRDRPE
jgi:hypothetical protein